MGDFERFTRRTLSCVFNIGAKLHLVTVPVKSTPRLTSVATWSAALSPCTVRLSGLADESGGEISNRLVGGEETGLRSRVGANLIPELRPRDGAVSDAHHVCVEVKDRRSGA